MRLQNEPALQDQHKHATQIEHEDDYRIETHQIDYVFANGVVIRCQVEYEYDDTLPKEASVCPPCDITYQVLNAANCHIEPMRKSFKNACQMNFWIQAHHLT